MTALLGLLALAGYQNRDKIGELLRGQGAGAGGAAGGGLAGALGGLFGAGAHAPSADGGGFLSGGLSELIDRFRQNGHGDVADSWIGTGPNKSIAGDKLEQAVGPDTIRTLSERTGLSREELLRRLSQALPDAVDRYTPDGRLPH